MRTSIARSSSHADHKRRDLFGKRAQVELELSKFRLRARFVGDRSAALGFECFAPCMRRGQRRLQVGKFRASILRPNALFFERELVAIERGTKRGEISR